ncbi:MAG: MFS transporter [Chloroflexota bacterium]
MATSISQPDGAAQGLQRKAFIFIVLTGFLSSIGFGIILPVAPFLVTRYVSDPASVGSTLGWLSSVYAICAFIAAPALGALSDRFGRRPILLICLFGSAVGYLCFGLGGALWMLFLGRIIDGLTGGNQGVLFAYIADLVPPKERGKYFGMIGAVFGIGFIAGPVLGALMAKLSYQAPFYFAAAVTFANVIWGLFFMPESLAKSQRVERVSLGELNPFSILRGVFAIPQLRWLLIAIFLYSLPFAALQVNLSLFARDSLHWDADAIGIIFAIIGITDIFVQGLLLQWLLQRFSEAQIAIAGLCCELAGYLLIASVVLFHTPVPLYLGTVIFAIGDGLLGPSLSALLSRSADERSQGTVQGGSQSVQSIARIAGPLLGGVLYDGLGYAAPYIAGAGIVGLAILAVIVALVALPRSATHGAIEDLPASSV